MSDIKWIKITTDVFDDEKIRLIESLPESDTVIIIWFKLLSMAGRCNDRGMIYLTRELPYNDEMLSTIMRRPVNTIRLAIQEFIKLDMISIIDDFIQVNNWEKHQNIEGMERVRLLRKARNKKYYDKNKDIEQSEMNEKGLIKTSCKTRQDTLDKTRLDKIRKDKKKDRAPSARLIKPTPEQVQEYLDSKGFTAFTGQYFCDSNNGKGWVTGKNNTPIKDWKAVVRTWIANDNNRTTNQPPKLKPYTKKQLEEFRQFNERIKGRI